jgi:hypothetical protein
MFNMSKMPSIAKTLVVFGVLSLLLVTLVESIKEREKMEGFIEKTQVYKTGMQTMRKCKREASRYAKEKMKTIKSNTKRYIRKCNL